MLDIFNNSSTKGALKILSPFDNFLIQRKRIKELFNFDYQIECYVPQAKRKFGYFSLPILWNNNLVARMDCKADRKNSILNIQHLAIESRVQNTTEFLEALSNELKYFLKFNNCTTIKLHKTTPASFKSACQKAIKTITLD